MEKQASREQEQMRREFISIKDQVCKHNGSDEELDNRKLLCDNFISKWGKVFDTKETREIIQNQTALDTILIRRKEEKLVADTIAEAQKNTTGKEDAKYRESIESCRRVIALLTLADTKKKLGDYVAELRQEAAGEALGKVKVLLQSDSREDWFTAYQKIDEIRAIIGDEPALLSEQRKIDDKFWAFYYSEAEKAVKEHRFSNARAHIACYERTGMKVHTADAMKANSWITHSEENFDWEETRKIADGYMKDHAYPPALAALDRFAQKYPNTQVIDIKQQRKTIADKFSAFIVDKREDLDSYQENLKVFLEKFPEETESIKTLKRFLCWSIHYTVSSIVYNDSIVSQAKNAQLAQIKYSDCEDYQKEYLKQLIAAAANYAVENSLSTLYEFQYYYQRPPKDCIKMRKSPTVYIVTVTSFEVDFSSSDYSLYRGGSDWDADPRIEIATNTGKKWNFLGPVNCQNFKVTEGNGEKFCFYLNSEGDDLVFSVRDADNGNLVAKDGPYRGVKWKANTFVRSGSDSYTFDSGTKITLIWNTI